MKALENWEALNETLMQAGEKVCGRLLAAEKAGRKRRTFLLRIHSRINRLRRQREREALGRAK